MHRYCTTDCGLDPTDDDVATCVPIIEDRVECIASLVRQADLSRLRQRPAGGGWSALEYAVHTRDVFRYHGWMARQGLDHDQPELPELTSESIDELPATSGYNEADPDRVIAELEAQAARFVGLARSLDADALHRQVRRGAEVMSLAFLVANVAHEMHHHHGDLVRLLTSASR